MQIVSVNSQNALSGVQRNLREGDFVFVRALKDLGGGKYTVSFAGGRFDVASERALREGQTFRAQVSFSGGKILLSPVQTGAQSGAAFLQGLGFVADGLAQRIMQFLTQSGSRLDPGLMQKVRRLAQKFKGREADAAEAALALEEKGIDSDSPALEKLMDLLGGGGSSGQDKDFGRGQNGAGGEDAAQGREGDGGSGNDSSGNGGSDLGGDSSGGAGLNGGSQKGAESRQGGGNFGRDKSLAQGQEAAAVGNAGELQGQEAPAVGEIAAELRAWFESILALADGQGGSDFRNESGAEGKEAGAAAEAVHKTGGDAGFLALFNQLPSLASSAEKKVWLCFPFEIARPQESGADGGKFFGGDLRLCLDCEKKLVEKALVAFKRSGANIYFAVYFNGKKTPRAVKAWADQEPLQKILRGALGELKAAFGADVKVEEISPCGASAFGVEDLPLFGVEAFA